MTPEQIHLVQESWKKMIPIRELAAVLFHARLFEIDPALKPLFPKPLDIQGRKLMATIGTAVGSLGRLDAIASSLQDLGRSHARRGVRADHYDTVVAALLWTLEQGLDTDFTPEVRRAWAAAFEMLTRLMKDPANDPGTTRRAA